jgi:thiamine biosynthesis lipoprotein
MSGVAAVRSLSRPGRDTFALWGGRAVVLVADRAGLEAAVVEVKRVVALFDRHCSSFREDAELALVNAAAGEPVVVSAVLLMAIRESLRVARDTDGLVDPTIGSALVAHGFGPQPAFGPPARIERAAGYRTVKLDEAASSVQLPRGVRLDLGATAKALAADIAATAATAAAGCGVLVSLCGDVATAGEPPPDGWQVRVTDDHRDHEGAGQTIMISEGAVATSSTTVRRREHRHHLINPTTGAPASGRWRTATVAASSCLRANAASTAAVIVGASAPAWLEHRRLPARLVAHDGRVCYLGGWPTEGDDL